MTDARKRLELFEQIEGKFGFQAKIATLITGVSGYYMLDVMNAWNRYQHLQFTIVRFTASNLTTWSSSLGQKQSFAVSGLYRKCNEFWLSASIANRNLSAETN
jgi:hypothetical protein